MKSNFFQFFFKERKELISMRNDEVYGNLHVLTVSEFDVVQFCIYFFLL